MRLRVIMAVALPVLAPACAALVGADAVTYGDASLEGGGAEGSALDSRPADGQRLDGGALDAPRDVYVDGCDAAAFLDFSCEASLTAADQVLFYRFDEGAGVVTEDCTGHIGHEGALRTYGTSLPTWVPGHRGAALHFDGTGGYVVVAQGDLDIGDAVTFSAWVNIKQGVSGVHAIIARNSGGGTFCGLLQADTAAEMMVDPTNVPYETALGGIIDRTDWVHVAGVYHYNDRLEVYVNGALEATTPPNPQGAFPYPGLPLYVGASGGFYFNGDIDEVRVFHRALSACEVAQLAKE